MEVLIQCDAGTYAMSSGEGEFATEEPGCQSSHCELLHQPILATLDVVRLRRLCYLSLIMCVLQQPVSRQCRMSSMPYVSEEDNAKYKAFVHHACKCSFSNLSMWYESSETAGVTCGQQGSYIMPPCKFAVQNALVVRC